MSDSETKEHLELGPEIKEEEAKAQTDRVTDTVTETVADMVTEGQPLPEQASSDQVFSEPIPVIQLDPGSDQAQEIDPETVSEHATDSVDGDADVETASERALLDAAAALDVQAIEKVTRGGVDVNYSAAYKKYRNALHITVLNYLRTGVDQRLSKGYYSKFVDILNLLMEHGLDINAFDMDNRTALHMAATDAGGAALIRVLISMGIKVNKRDKSQQTALMLAVQRAEVEDVQALIDGEADINAKDCLARTALHLAAKRRYHPEILTLLINKGADVNTHEKTKNRHGGTALHTSCKAGIMENVHVLLEHGALPELKDSSGQKPVHLAAANDKSGKILPALISNGANVNAPDEVFMETPLHKAVSREMMENFKVLIEAGANANVQDATLETPLHKASKCTQIIIWSQLLRRGAKVNIQNNIGHTPVDKAWRERNNVAMTMMQQYMKR